MSVSFNYIVNNSNNSLSVEQLGSRSDQIFAGPDLSGSKLFGKVISGQ